MRVSCDVPGLNQTEPNSLASSTKFVLITTTINSILSLHPDGSRRCRRPQAGRDPRMYRAASDTSCRGGLCPRRALLRLRTYVDARVPFEVLEFSLSKVTRMTAVSDAAR